MSKQEEEERISYILETLKDEELKHLLTEYRQSTNPVVLISILSHLNVTMKNDAIGAVIPQFKLNEPNEIILGAIVLQGQLFKITLRIYGDIDSEAQLLITKEGSIEISVRKNG